MATGEIIRPGDKKFIPNEGMPTYRRPYEKGRLIINFSVRSPFLFTFEFLSVILKLAYVALVTLRVSDCLFVFKKYYILRSRFQKSMTWIWLEIKSNLQSWSVFGVVHLPSDAFNKAKLIICIIDGWKSIMSSMDHADLYSGLYSAKYFINVLTSLHC